MVRVRSLKVFARDPDLVIRGPLPWSQARLTLNHLAVGSWTLNLPGYPRVVEQMSAGWGIVAYLDGEKVMSGSVEDPTHKRERGQPVSASEVTGADDLAIVGNMLAWPNPTALITAQTASAKDSRSGTAEAVIKGYVSANIGTARHASRRDPAAPLIREVTVPASLGRGSAVEYSARFENLMEIIRSTSGGLAVTCMQNDQQQIVFDVHEPRDLTAGVLFSMELGNLTAVEWQDAMPETTHAIVAGEGEGTARNIRWRTDSAAANLWRMATETLVNENSTIVEELNAAGDEELEEGRRAGIITATLLDTPRLRFGTHYTVGDRVTISPAPDTAFSDVITSVVIDANRETGALEVTPSVGWASDGPYETRQDRQIARLTRQVSVLERG